MRKRLATALLSTAILGVGLTASAQEGNGFMKYEVIEGKFVSGELPLNPTDSAWKGAKEQKVYLYPQISVRLNDKKANEAIPKKEKVEAKVKVIYNDKNIAVMVSWKDDTPSIQPVYDTNKFADAVSIEFPNKFGAGITLPYIGMGDENHPVSVYLKKVVAGREYQKSFVSKGFGSLTEIQEKGVKVNMKYNNGQWTAIFVRPLQTENSNLKAGLVPIGFAIWDGNKYERDGNKSLSRWKFIRLDKYQLDNKYLQYVSWGMPYADWPEKGQDIGDPAKGKQLFQTNCAACHRAGDIAVAPEGLAPNLSDIGGIANAIYLKESIVNPNDVVIRNLNPNRHYNKSAQPDKFRAYPNNDMFTWYINVNGKKQSKMPPFSHLKEQDINDLVAFLKTLIDWKNFK